MCIILNILCVFAGERCQNNRWTTVIGKFCNLAEGFFAQLTNAVDVGGKVFEGDVVGVGQFPVRNTVVQGF